LTRGNFKRAFGEWRWFPTLLLAMATIASGLLAFAPQAGDGALSPLIFVPHLLLCWLAARSGMLAASATVLLLTGGAALATATGHGPFYQGQLASSIALLWGYACTLSATPLLVTAIVGDLSANDARWQLALDSSHIGVAEWDVAAGR